jgi:AAA+ ATPase superfamily predicted ATPase
MKFHGRTAELTLLQELSQLASRFAQMTVLLGRRRVGKTELVRQHLQQVDRGVYFFVEKRPSQVLLNEFSETLRTLIPHAPLFSDWKDFFVFLCAETRQHPTVVVFDEFQNFLTVEPSVYSILQGVWDEWHKDSKLHLIAVGSVVGLMKKVFQDANEPLYGRMTREIDLGPLPLAAVLQMTEGLGFGKASDRLTLYGLFGGMPRYYEIIEHMGLGGRPITEIMRHALFSAYAPFRQEVRDIILAEFGHYTHIYLAILEAIASGKTRLSEIAGPVGMPASSLPKYMRELSDMFNLVERQVPAGEDAWRSKKGHYRIRDPFIAFWMGFIYRQFSIYEAGHYRYFLDRLEVHLTQHMGLAFEGIVKERLNTLNSRGQAPIAFHRIGRWWNRQMEIDLIALSEDTGEALFVECKWTSRPIGPAVLAELKRKAQAVPYRIQHMSFLLASKSGFTPALRKLQDPTVDLWDLVEISSNAPSHTA